MTARDMCHSTATWRTVMGMGRFVRLGCFGAILGLLTGPALAQQTASVASGGGGGCRSLPNNGALRAALKTAVTEPGNNGFGLNMWATIVDNSGIVCAVAFSGNDFTQQWLGSRVISAQKANTGNAFSLCKGCTPQSSAVQTAGLAISSANLYSAVQPGGSLYGLQASNPVETDVAYGNFAGGQGNGPASGSSFGTPNDPLVGERVGGINVFGGGLGLYKGGVRVGGIGVSGDTSCTDHMVAWWTRNLLTFDGFSGVPGPASVFAKDGGHPDNIIYDIAVNALGQTQIGVSATGFGHPTCFNPPALQQNSGGQPTAAGLPAVH
jgi:hypothetical protein